MTEIPDWPSLSDEEKNKIIGYVQSFGLSNENDGAVLFPSHQRAELWSMEIYGTIRIILRERNQ